MDKKKVLTGLKEFISIQSVSADSTRFSEIQKAVQFLDKKLQTIGFTVQVFESSSKTNVPPLIVASKIISDKAHTIGVYGHYDVQPEDPVNEWKTEPFKLTVDNGKLYGRGVADNKGHLWQNITAVEELLSEKKLNNNIVFIFEGEEESGSENFKYLVKEAKGSIEAADVFYVTDENMFKKNVPQIGYGLRGLVYFELEISIGKRDLHSGVYGNRVLNPVLVLAELFSKMKDSTTGIIQVPGYYENVRKPDQKEFELLSKTQRAESEELKEAQVQKIIGVKNIPSYLAAVLSPSLDIHGIISGYTGLGAKTVIPKSVSVKFSSRLVEYQDPDSCEKMIKEFIKANLPDGVSYKLTTLSKDAPFYTDINNNWVKKTANIFKNVFGNETIFNRSGGSIPAAGILSDLLGKPIILTGFTLPDDNIHAPNENFDEEMFWKGIEALKEIYCSV